jgi:hypothetical protein
VEINPRVECYRAASRARRKGRKTAAMSFWCLLASGQITIAKIEGWRNLAERPFDQIIDLGA